RVLKIPAEFDKAHVYGINRDNVVVGQLNRSVATSGVDADKSQAFEYVNGKFVVLSGAESKAKAINAAGTVVGENNPQGPVVWNHETLLPLNSCCGGRALAINDAGQVVGEAGNKEGRFSAFFGNDGKLQLIDPPNSRSSTALAINNAGRVLVQS